MQKIKLSDSELRFMHLIWDKEPINSTELVRYAENTLGWKKSTTYTVLRRLKQRGILKNEQAIVTSLIKKSDVQQATSNEILGKIYEGSITTLLAAFLKQENISHDEVKELRHMIDHYLERKE
ncbi:MAG: BlaI/MecI/CopY family transcriptional regulator [Cellulosilyticaceae bacterium]